MAVVIRFEPRDTGDGLLRMVEVFVAPKWRSGEAGREKVRGVFGVGDLSGGEEEGVDPDTVDGAFAILTGGGAHEEPSFGDGD